MIFSTTTIVNAKESNTFSSDKLEDLNTCQENALKTNSDLKKSHDTKDCLYERKKTISSKECSASYSYLKKLYDNTKVKKKRGLLSDTTNVYELCGEIIEKELSSSKSYSECITISGADLNRHPLDTARQERFCVKQHKDSISFKECRDTSNRLKAIANNNNSPRTKSLTNGNRKLVLNTCELIKTKSVDISQCLGNSELEGLSDLERSAIKYDCIAKYIDYKGIESSSSYDICEKQLY